MQAVIHLSDADRADRAFRNASTLLGPTVNVEDVALVANDDGVHALAGDEGYETRVARLVDAGLVVRACRSSLRRNGLSRETLLDDVETVPSGVAHLVSLQDLGWAYLKP
jgi:hypothetical protein